MQADLKRMRLNTALKGATVCPYKIINSSQRDYGCCTVGSGLLTGLSKMTCVF